MSASRLPRQVDQAVASRLFADMERLGWEGLTLQERSFQYSLWMADPDVGGRLTAFMAPERGRVWIKDGPIKEYPRALAGIGKYAPLVDGRDGASAIVQRALGNEWVADETTLKVKPLRVEAHYAEETVVLTWGPVRDLKHLVWAAINADVMGDPRVWVSSHHRKLRATRYHQ